MATTSEKLIEAQTALHSLLTGTSEISITYRERTVMYRAANIEALRAYIIELQNLLLIEAGGVARRRSFNFIYN